MVRYASANSTLLAIDWVQSFSEITQISILSIKDYYNDLCMQIAIQIFNVIIIACLEFIRKI